MHGRTKMWLVSTASAAMLCTAVAYGATGDSQSSERT